MAGELAEGGMLAAYYHADMDPATREGVHLQWSQGMKGPLNHEASASVIILRPVVLLQGILIQPAADLCHSKQGCGGTAMATMAV